MSFDTTPFFHILISQIQSVGVCSSPNQLQWSAIVAMVGLAGVFAVSTGVGVVAVASTIVTLVGAGSSIAAIAAAIADQVGITVGSLEVLSSLVSGIKSILGC